MGLLKKLAGLVVEFPEDDKERQRRKSDESGETDVVEAIEQIRLNIEQGKTMDFGESEPVEPNAPPGPTAARPVVTHDVLAPQVSAGDSSSKSIKPPVPLTIEQIYEKAGLKPEGEFDIFKVERMLNDPEIQDLTVELRARMVRMTLKNMGRDLADILKDAGMRDQAMEQYQSYLERQVADTEVRIARANESLQRQIDEYVRSHTAMIEENNGKLAQARSAIEEYKKIKSAEEQRLFDVAAPFVGDEANPVELD